MSSDFLLATQIRAALTKSRILSLQQAMNGNSKLTERYKIAIERAAQRLAGQILTGRTPKPLRVTDAEYETEEATTDSTGPDQTRKVSSSERAVLIAMYCRLRAYVRCMSLSEQTRADFWKKDEINSGKDAQYYAFTSRLLSQTYASLLIPTQENIDKENAGISLEPPAYVDVDKGPVVGEK